jgi:c-di-GMP-binding flagellar brake protein YcgR
MKPEQPNGNNPERRRSPRLGLRLWVKFKTIVNGKISEAFENFSDNISAGGLGIRRQQPFSKQQMMMIRLFLPPEKKWEKIKENATYIGDEALEIMARSRVVWCSPVNPNEFRIGLEFLELDRYSQERLREFLMELADETEQPEK